MVPGHLCCGDGAQWAAVVVQLADFSARAVAALWMLETRMR